MGALAWVQGFEPVLEYIEGEAITSAAAITWPEIGLAEAHEIKRLGGQAVAAIGPLLGIGKPAVTGFDPALPAADIGRRADMPFHGKIAHAHLRAGAEAGFSHLAPPSPRGVNRFLPG